MGAYWQAHAAGSSWECHPPPPPPRAAYPPFSSSLTFSYFSLIKHILILIQKTYLESRIIKLAQNWCSWTKNSSVATSWIRKRWEKCNVSHYFDVPQSHHMTHDQKAFLNVCPQWKIPAFFYFGEKKKHRHLKIILTHIFCLLYKGNITINE